MTAQSQETTLLTVENISVDYGGQFALRDVSLDFPSGTVTAILGPNGAGKTTLMRALAGLQPVSSGSIRIDGVDATNLAANLRVKAGVCLVPEGRGVFRNLSVRENLLCFIPPWVKSKDVSAAVEAFPILGERIDQTAGTLSGGQQQMLALARCYLSAPRLILLDEVSMGLAPLVVDQIFDSIEVLAERGTALAIVEQYAEKALALASRAYVLNRGSVVFEGAASDLSRGDLLSSYLGTGA